MKAAVLHAPASALKIEDVDIEQPKSGEVLVRINAAGVCHSDYHFMVGDRILDAYPAILGHEGAGVVEAVGEGVDTVEPGDHVVLARSHCGHCDYCHRGEAHLCRVLTGVLTGTMPDGTTRFRLNGKEVRHFGGISCFAEKTVIPEQGVVKIPKDVPFEIAAVIGCAVITGVGAVKNAAAVRPGSHVLIIGVGGVGLNAVIGARLAGASRVIACDALESRLEMAKTFGASAIINASQQNTVDVVMEMTAGAGVDYAFDITGTGTGLSTAYAALKRGGTAVAVGMPHPDVQGIDINPLDLVRTEKTIKGSYMGSAPAHVDIPRLIDLYCASRLPLDRLLSRKYPLAEVNEAYEAMMSGRVARTVVIP